MTDLNWYILGAGSMGCLWAGWLWEKGLNPIVIVRPERFDRLEKKQVPLHIRTCDGRSHHYRVTLTSADGLPTPIDRLIVCTKAQDARDAVLAITSHLSPTSQILLLQNGMGSQQQLAMRLPETGVWAGSSTDGAFLEAPFSVCHAGCGETVMGLLHGGRHPEPRAFAPLQESFGLKVQQVAAIEPYLWRKLAVNCCINGLTALYNCHNGALLDNPRCYVHLRAVIVETRQALAWLGVSLQEDLAALVASVCRNTASNISSTCQDARAGRVTELAYINGFLMQRVRQLGLDLPVHARLLAKLKNRGIKL